MWFSVNKALSPTLSQRAREWFVSETEGKKDPNFR